MYNDPKGFKEGELVLLRNGCASRMADGTVGTIVRCPFRARLHFHKKELPGQYPSKWVHQHGLVCNNPDRWEKIEQPRKGFFSRVYDFMRLT